MCKELLSGFQRHKNVFAMFLGADGEAPPRRAGRDYRSQIAAMIFAVIEFSDKFDKQPERIYLSRMGMSRKLQVRALRGVDFSVNGLVVGNDDKARTVNVFEQRFGRKAGGVLSNSCLPCRRERGRCRY